MRNSNLPGRFTRRELLSSGAGLIIFAAAPARAQATRTFTPEEFGARGDGVTNDTKAFARLSEAVTKNGGGTITLRRTTYIVGAQRQDPTGRIGYAFAPWPILQFIKVPGPIEIRGNGATLRCAPGLRYGTFDPATGAPTSHKGRFLGARERATPYEYMIHAEHCEGPITISDIELDGNLPRLVIGGTYGDSGRQIAGSGIFLRDNRSDEIVRNVYTHHHGQDGIMISGLDDEALGGRVRRAERIRSEYNARQGCSIVGGRNWHFSHCRFAHTGRGAFASAPCAGLDIEAEGGRLNRDHVFEDCDFIDNSGCGMVADSGDSEGATFTRCRFIGTTNWSAWPSKPRFSFHGCTFVGSIVRCFGDPDPARATQFFNCLLTDDPALSPTGQVYREGRPHGSLADLDSEQNVLFEHCRFQATHGSVLPWSTAAIYSNCTMQQTTEAPGYPRGTYKGQNRIESRHIDLYGTHFPGRLILNGQPYPPR